MNLAVIGMGYVGVVTAAVFSGKGHQVVGLDIDTQKVTLLNRGVSPISEPGVQELISASVSSKHFSAMLIDEADFSQIDIALVCVGTPIDEDGSLELSTLETVVKQLYKALPGNALIAIRSTVSPGTISALERICFTSGGRSSSDISIVFNPEFLREGSAVKDFNNPAFTVVGAKKERSASQLMELYSDLKSPAYIVEPEVAEMLKLVNNTFHALKITFSNEIGAISKDLGIDGRKVLELFCKDDVLNISTAYMKPAFAYGGSCLPKDLSALNKVGSSLNLELPLLGNISTSNDAHIERAKQWLKERRGQTVLLIGITFKAGTDDLRDSPIVELVKWLHLEKFSYQIYDPFLLKKTRSQVVSAHIESHLPFIEEKLLQTIDSDLMETDSIILGTNLLSDTERAALQLFTGNILDLSIGWDPTGSLAEGNYQGLCW
jgi:GDP-mannose 6-dehydrogenase